MLDRNGNAVTSPLDRLFSKGLQFVNPPHQYECLMPDGSRQRVDAFVADDLVDGRVALVPCRIADDSRFMEPIVGFERIFDETQDNLDRQLASFTAWKNSPPLTPALVFASLLESADQAK